MTASLVTRYKIAATAAYEVRGLNPAPRESFTHRLKAVGYLSIIYIELFNKNRNLIPVVSIEGHEDKTDTRRGEAVHLAPGDREREYLTAKLRSIREKHPEIVFVSFPGDEKSSGGFEIRSFQEITGQRGSFRGPCRRLCTL
ncbi:MAG: hypothetical protein MJ131_11230 [Lachnospiraceae bacterium]|nr:hypothetical protein [Lachnospiraceae bacterium]